jgi:AcrR family transcriptional regulator
MPYPAGHRERVRERIVDSARLLFNRNGFDGVSVDAIMADAGLTRGAFYSYFEAKSDLYAEVLGCFFTDPNFQSRWEGVEVDLTSAEASPQIVRAYLSRRHFENVEDSCPMVALPGDVARGDARVKAAFEKVFRGMVSVLAGEVKGKGRRREDAAMAIAALCVGGMVVARSMGDDGFAERLRHAATRVALELGGWRRGVVRKERGRRAKSAGAR